MRHNLELLEINELANWYIQHPNDEATLNEIARRNQEMVESDEYLCLYEDLGYKKKY